MKFSEKTKKIISSLLIIAVIVPTILFSKPQKTDASLPVIDFASIAEAVFGSSLHIKDIAVEVLKEVARTFLKKLLQQMTQQTVNWINSGFHGSPLFVQNPDSFFNDIAKSEIKTLVSQYGYDSNRYPYGANFAQNIINSYKATAGNNAAYTLSNVINDPTLLNNYRTNFNYGGWNGFLVNTQYPQNNYLGFQILATDQLARQLNGTSQNAAQKVQTALQQGNGFLSPQMCPKTINPDYNTLTNEFDPPVFTPLPYKPPEFITEVGAKLTPDQQNDLDAYNDQYNIDNNEAKDTFNGKSGCINPQTGKSALVATTPGSVVGSQIGTALGSSIHSTELGAAIGGSISAILDSLLNHFLDEGLSALSSTINPTPSNDTGPGTCATGGTNGIALPSLTNKNDCTSLGGTWTSGAPATVPIIKGTCTTEGGASSLTTQNDCTIIGGNWSTAAQATGACSFSDGTSAVSTEDICAVSGGTWNSTSTSTNSNGSDTTTGTGNNSTPTTTVTTSNTGVCTVPTSGTSTSGTTKSTCDTSGGSWKADSVTTTTISYPGGVQTQTDVTVNASGTTICTSSKGLASCTPTTTSTSSSSSSGSSSSGTTCPVTTSLSPVITSVQGYNATTNTYTPAVYANNYMIIYGTGFDPKCANVWVSGTTYFNISYVSSTQINILLGGTKGTSGLQVITGQVEGYIPGTYNAVRSNDYPVTIQ